MSSKTGKALVIGLDGGSFELLDALDKRGLVPHLSALCRNAASGTMLSTVPPFTVPAWSSMMTGKNPGKHGVISFFERDPHAYQCQDRGEFVNGLSVAGQTLWAALSQANREVIVVNVPMTYPPRPVNGVLISGMLTPYSASNFTYPSELATTLPDYQIDLQYARRGNRIDPEAYPRGVRLIEELRTMTRKRKQVSLQLMRERSWDLFVVIFTGTDRMCHFFWPELTDPENGDKEIVVRAEEYYTELDTAVGELMAEAGSETFTMVISDHGFGPAPGRRFYPNLWLESEGWLRRREGGSGASLEKGFLKWLHRHTELRQLLKRALPSGLRDRVRESTREDIERDIDWAKTQAYFVPMSNNICGIEINRVGRKPYGVVKDHEVDLLRQHIIQAARRLIDPATGKPMVIQAQCREEVYTGPYVETFPDLILTIDTGYACSMSLRGADIVDSVLHPRRPGEHRREGILMAQGPEVRAEKFNTPARLEDVMPTVLYALSEAIPDDLDGKVLVDLFSGDLQNRPPRYRKAVETGRAGSKVTTEAEQAAVRDRLSGLGYL